MNGGILGHFHCEFTFDENLGLNFAVRFLVQMNFSIILRKKNQSSSQSNALLQDQLIQE